MKEKITGSEALLRAFEAEGVDTIFGYPGGQIMPVYDRLYYHTESLRHILVRHEQGAIHAAQGYARVKGCPGVVIVTSGPGATNVLTGLADAMTDSTPVVVVTGQVTVGALGTDAFQEADVIGLTSPITKWNYQIRSADEIAWAVSRAFYIASSGRPGPVVLDFTKDAQNGLVEDFSYSKCEYIRTYIPDAELDADAVEEAARLIDAAKKPFLVFGQGITLSGAENALKAFLEKTGIPCGATLLGLSALPTDFPLYKGMIGMHGNIAPNLMTDGCDLLVAVGMRFDDRVTGTVATYARNAKVIHIDIDSSEIGKIIPVNVGILADARKALEALTEKVSPASHTEWIAAFDHCREVEEEKVIAPQLRPLEGPIRMGEVIDRVAEETKGRAIIVTDVGQNQLLAARYSRFQHPRSFISSGGLGTMGFGIPAAIGAKVAAPETPVCLFVGDGGVQMTIQEFGTIMQEHVGVKIVILNNNWLGNVRQWQELFFGARYSYTRMLNPDYAHVAAAYGISYAVASTREELAQAVSSMLSTPDAFILEARVLEDDHVMPMIPPGKGITDIMVTKDEFLAISDKG